MTINQYTNSPPRPAKILPDGTIEIQLTKGYVAIIDAEDADLTQFNWFSTVSSVGRCYAVRNKPRSERDSRKIYLHQVILSRILGRDLSSGEFSDHINGNTFDNRRLNLRVATKGQNNQNKAIHKNNRTGYKGCTYSKRRRKWVAQISLGGKSHYIGRFNTPEEAHAAYCAKAKELFGEFARID